MGDMTGGEAVVAALRALGVEHVFGIVSVHNIPIYDAIARDGTGSGHPGPSGPIPRRWRPPPASCPPRNGRSSGRGAA